MGGRKAYLVVVISLLAAAIVAVPQLVPPQPSPTETDLAGVFTCDEQVSELDQYLGGLGDSLLAGDNLFTFQGLAPPGVPVEGGGTPDPGTGGTVFNRTLGPAQLGQARGVDFLSEDEVPGAAGDELVFRLEIQGNAGANGDDLGVKRLFNQNFGLPDEAGGDISALRVDIEFTANQAMTALPSGFRGAFEGVFQFELPDGTLQPAGFRVELNSLAAGTAVPGQSTLGVVFKQPDDEQLAFFALGQRVEFAGFDGSANQPGLAFGVDLALIDPGSTERDLVAADLGWGATPRQTALGWAKQCPSDGRFGWNLDPAGLPDPTTASVDVDFRLGDRTGQEITVDDGNGGAIQTRASEAAIDARIDGLPSLMDFIMLEDALSFTRSAEAAPDVTVDRFHVAFEDPAREDELPLHATAQLTDMARHVLFVRSDNPDTGAFEGGELTSWTLSCPGEPPPGGSPAPEDVRRPERTDTLPAFPGCERHALAPIPAAQLVAQNWLPEDLDARAATADLRTPPLDAGQFAYLATRDNNPLSSDGLFAFGGRITGLERVTADLSDAPDNADPVRLYLQRAPGTTADDSARLVVDVDSLNPPPDAGTRISGTATIADLPNALRVDLASLSPSRGPLDVAWWSDTPIAISDGTFDAYWSGRGAFELHGAFETGAVGGGPLPPAARIQVTRNNSADQRNELRYTAPEVPADGFPTPDVPAFDPTAIARLHLGAELTMDDDRQAGVATRLHADIEVPQPIKVYWESGPDNRVRTVAGDLCPDSAEREPCTASHLDVTVVRGPRTDLSPNALLTRPALPTPTSPVSEAVPAFTEFRPGSGVRAVVLGPDAWGADLVIDGVARVVYRREQPVVVVQLANLAEQPFGINLLDASKTADTGLGERTLVLFADAAIDRLPRMITARLQDTTASADQPWLWINTQSTGIRDVADVDWTEDPAGTRPHLTGVLRLGDAVALRNNLPVAERPTLPRSASGADVWADYDLDTQIPSLDAVLSLDIPRHVAVWRPTDTHCDGTTDDPDTCVYRPSYELDHTDNVDLQYMTTSAALGDLNVAATLRGGFHFEQCGLGCVRAVWNTLFSARARIDRVPGQLDTTMTIAENQRLPWLTVDVDVKANTSPGSMWAEVRDLNHPVEYRQDADPANQGQCSEPSDQCTGVYAIDLQNVPAIFHVTGRLQGYAEERLTPGPPVAPPPPPDPTTPETNLGALGFGHVSLDLQNAVQQVTVNVREAADGQMVGRVESFDADGNVTPISGFLNARLDHVSVELPRVGTDQADPFLEYFFDRGGVIGIGLCKALSIDEDPCSRVAPFAGAFGRAISPTVLMFDVIGGILFEVFFEGDVDTEIHLDFDLPLFIGFDRIDGLQLAQNGSTLSVDERHPGAGDPATIAVRQQSLPHEDELRIDGAYYHHRDVEFIYDTLFELDNFDITNQADDAIGDVGLYRHRDCEDPEFQGCYVVDFGSNEVSLDEVASDPDEGRPGFESADVLVDVVFTPDNRAEMEEEGPGVASPGDIYDKIAENAQPVPAEAFVFPDLPIGLLDRLPGFFASTTYCCNRTTFSITRPDNPPPAVQNLGPVCAVSDPDAVLEGPRAIGSDGIEYVVVRKASNTIPADRERTLCDATQLLLEAHFPVPGDDLGPVRWSIVLPSPAGLENGGECRTIDVRCEVEIRVAPQAGGSVHVEMTTEVFAGGVDGDDLNLFVQVPSSNTFPPTRNEALFFIRRMCCSQPTTFLGDRSVLDPAFAWVDASGHPGFDRPEATAVDDLNEVIVPIDQSTGIATLDPCTIAPDFGCASVPAGHTTQWLYGDGIRTEPVGGAPTARNYRYPRGTPNPDIFLGMLIHYDEDGEVVETAQFRPAGA